MSRHLRARPGSSVHYLMDVEKQSITMEKLKKQMEALGLEEKQKTKCLMEEWKRLCECEEKRLEAEGEHELESRQTELERARLEFESKKGERGKSV